MKQKTIYIVVIDTPQTAAGNTDTVRAFTNMKEAGSFAAMHTHYGRPAVVTPQTMPAHVAARQLAKFG